MKRIEELEDLIRHHSQKYYNETAEISDDAFDALVDELKSLKPDSEILKIVGAPVAFERKWKKTIHQMPMGSLVKIKVEDLPGLFDKYKGQGFVISQKYDGLSLELVYEKGRLQKAITRGDGEIGEDIYENVLKMNNVCSLLPDRMFTGSLRAEIVMLKSHFEVLNEIEGNDFANPRNAAAGIAKGHEGKNCEYLTLKYYGVHSTDDYHTEMSKFNYLRFLTLIDDHCFHEIVGEDELMNIYLRFIEIRNSLEYNIDGLVITLADLSLHDTLGFLNGKPKFAWALKFPPLTLQSKICAVNWTVTRTGRVNPVAQIVPIEIDGSTVEFATLHNLDYIKKLGLGIDDEVMIKKAGDIIPAIVEVVIHRNKPISIPIICPVCQSKLVNTENFLWCVNPNCPAQTLSKLVRYCKILELDYVGSGLLEKLFDAQLAVKPSDLYDIDEDQMLHLDGVGDSIAANFLNELERKSNLTLHKFIVALSLDGLADKNAEVLANYVEKNDGKYMSFNHFMRTFTHEELKSLYTEQTAAKIFDELTDNQEDILDLFDKVTIIKGKKLSDILQGKSFCITGPMEFAKRDDYIKMIKENGGEYKGSVGKGLSLLVTNDTESGTSKNKKAKEFGTKIINESELRNMLSLN